MTTLAALASEEYAYLTTTGRRTGAPHEIEIWFATDGQVLWMISGGHERADWVQNLLAGPDAVVRIAGESFTVRARPALTDPSERRRAAAALHAKYAAQVSATASQWGSDAYLLAFDVR
jgi:deazaflavin-dependent oxidoreductase (nitroreductase family)